MSEELPAQPYRVLDDLGIVIADPGIQRRRGTDSALRQYLHDAEYADARSVIAERPGRYIRDLAAGARYRLVQCKHFNVRAYPDGDSRAVRPF